MRRPWLLALLWASACAAAPPAPRAPPARAALSAALPSASAAPLPASPPPELPPAPPLPFHRFAALVPGELARFFAVAGRPILRVGERLFSLTPGQMHRETALEKALAGPDGGLSFGAIGGRYPDQLVVDRPLNFPDRKYLSIRNGKTKEIARAQDPGGDVDEILRMPDERLLVRGHADGPDGPIAWLSLIPAPKSPVEEGFVGYTSSPFSLVQRSDGSVALVRRSDDQNATVWSWSKGAAEPTKIEIALGDDEGPVQLFETTDKVLFLRTPRALYQQTADGFRREEAEGSALFPLPEGAWLLGTAQGLLVRDRGGTTTRASWPAISIEGRQFPAKLVSSVCTRESGFWAISADGLGLYHDKAPAELVQVSTLPAGATPATKPGGAP